jgi:hypothetical protein
MSKLPDGAANTDEGATESSLLPAPVSLTAAHEQPIRRPPHRERFRVALAILAGIGVGAIAIAIAVLVANRGTTTAKTATVAWSPWSPGVSGGQGATAIADHVAPYYRVNVARQLDVVTPMALSNPSANGTITGNGLVVAVNTGSARSEKLSLLGGNTIAYNICGLGTSNCALGGKPSSARLLLLRREALELALYSFKYINGTQNVIAMLPPGRTETSAQSSSAHGSKGSHAAKASKPLNLAVLFVKPELQPWLSTPLKRTLAQIPPDVPELPLWTHSNEAGLVDQVTARGLFASSIETQSGTKLLVLRSIPPQ